MAGRRCLIVTGAAAAVVALAACADRAASVATQRVSIAGQRFELELALDDLDQYQGLSERDSIDPDGGMLFVFSAPAKLEFVMRRCYVPIDLIFLNSNGYVIKTYRMPVERDPHAPHSQLQKYRSVHPAQFAIELRGGTLDQLKLKIADTIDLPLEKLKKMAKSR